MMTGFFGKKKNLVEGGRYRPLALTTHAIEWQIFGKKRYGQPCGEYFALWVHGSDPVDCPSTDF